MSGNKQLNPILMKKFAVWFARKLFWFFFIPFLSLLGYYTQIRPFIIENHGWYSMGFTDGVLITICLLILTLWLYHKIPSEKAEVAKTE